MERERVSRLVGSVMATPAALIGAAAEAFVWNGVAGVALWLIVILAPLLVLRPGFWLILRPLSRRAKQALDQRRYVAWMVALWGGLSIIVFCLGPMLLEGRFDMPVAAQIIGVLVGMASPVLTISAVRSLGWRRAVCLPTLLGGESGEPSALMASGPYRFVRNPMYLSEMCALLGGFLISGFVALFCMFLLWLPMMGFVIPLEEAELRERFGAEQYDAYARRVASLLPWLW